MVLSKVVSPVKTGAQYFYNYLKSLDSPPWREMTIVRLFRLFTTSSYLQYSRIHFLPPSTGKGAGGGGQSTYSIKI